MERVAISTAVLDTIRAAAAASPAREVCGLLTGTSTRIDGAIACANVADDPATRFEIDPAALFAALRAARGGGPAVAGCWHSHPSGAARPSACDAAAAAGDGWVWVIVAGGAVTAWRAVADGAVAGRFDRLRIAPC